MDANDTHPPANKKAWWIAWILLSTVLGPVGVVGLSIRTPAMVWLVMLLVVLSLHMVASVKLSRKRLAGDAVLLVIGGWLVMLMFSFFGCMVVVSQASH